MQTDREAARKFLAFFFNHYMIAIVSKISCIFAALCKAGLGRGNHPQVCHDFRLVLCKMHSGLGFCVFLKYSVK